MSSNKIDIVLIPGAAHGQSSMRFLRGALEARGYTVNTPVLPCVNCEPPTKTLLDDIGVIKSTLSSIIKGGRDVVVAGHSAGALTGSGAVAGLEKQAGDKAGVVGLVFMSGMLLPKGGVSVRDIFGQPQFEIPDGNYIRVSEDFVTKQFYSDVPEDIRQQEMATIKHMPLGFWATKLPAVPWTETETTLPITYVSFTEDQLFGPEKQKMMYSSIPGVQVKEVKAGHMGVLSQPEKTAEVIHEIVKGL